MSNPHVAEFDVRAEPPTSSSADVELGDKSTTDPPSPCYMVADPVRRTLADGVASGLPVRWPDLLTRAQALVDVGDRQILGITGAPGAGKSTVARRLVDELGDAAVLVGMDGYHLAQAELERLGCTERKGAPDTFDAAGYVALLHRLRVPAAGTVYAPEFRRAIEEPIAGAIPVPSHVRLVVTEGNYLLLEAAPWSAIRGLLDEVWFLAPDEQTRRAWLTTRHRRYGRTAKQAAERTSGSDERNASLIAPTASRADLILDPTRLI